jgi:hypothetical protein
MANDAESLYLQLGQLVSEMPPSLKHGTITPDMNRWLGRAAYLVKQVCGSADAANFDLACNHLDSMAREISAQTILAIVYRALAAAEANAPSAARGGFVAVGAALDALQVIGKVLAQAQSDVCIVDPYMDSKVFTDFAPTAGPTAAVRLLSDSHNTKPEAIRPALTRWIQQFKGRVIEVRLTPPRSLHDRLIVADGKLAWTITQSLKDFANRSPALVQRVDPDMAAMKIDFYNQVWATATPLT